MNTVLIILAGAILAAGILDALHQLRRIADELKAVREQIERSPPQ